MSAKPLKTCNHASTSTDEYGCFECHMDHGASALRMELDAAREEARTLREALIRGKNALVGYALGEISSDAAQNEAARMAEVIAALASTTRETDALREAAKEVRRG